MGYEPQPLHQELYLPVITPEMAEKLKKDQPASDKSYSRIVIDMNGDILDQTVYGEES